MSGHLDALNPAELAAVFRGAISTSEPAGILWERLPLTAPWRKRPCTISAGCAASCCRQQGEGRGWVVPAWWENRVGWVWFMPWATGTSLEAT